MKLGMVKLLVVALVGSTPLTAQDFGLSPLEQSAGYERNRMMLRSDMRQKQRWDAKRSASQAGPSSATPLQARACAGKARLRAQYGADHPQIRQIYDKCRSIGL